MTHSNLPLRTPPGRIVSLACALLPPSKREQVLGDLQERFYSGPDSSAWTYFVEVWKSVPRLTLRSLLKRNPLFGFLSNLSVAGAPARRVSYEARIRELEDTIWRSHTVSRLIGPLAMVGSTAYTIWDHSSIETFVGASIRALALALLITAMHARYGPPDSLSLLGAKDNPKTRYRFEADKWRTQLWMPSMLLITGISIPMPHHPPPILSATYTSLAVVSVACLWVTASRYYSLRLLQNQIAQLDTTDLETPGSKDDA